MARETPTPESVRPLPSAIGERERERAVRQLGDHFAQDHLTLDEYEFRVQAALQATQWYQLDATTNDLPPLSGPNARPAMLEEPVEEIGTKGKSRTLLAIMGGLVRRGSWLVPKRLQALAIMGGVELDLRDATLTGAITEIHALALMGGIEIIVPPGVRLEVDGLAIMGGFEDQAGKFPAVAPHDAPVVRVTGLALMGAVVTCMKPRGWDASDDRE